MSRRLLKAIYVASPPFNMVKSGDGFLHLAHQKYRNCCVARAPGTQRADTEGRFPVVAASSSFYSPRVTRPGRQTAGLLLVLASRVASLSLLLQHRTDVIGRASPAKSSSWGWRTREERYPHDAEDNGSSCPSAPTTGGPCLPGCNAAMVRLVSRMLISAYFYIPSPLLPFHSPLSIIREGK